LTPLGGVWDIVCSYPFEQHHSYLSFGFPLAKDSLAVRLRVGNDRLRSGFAPPSVWRHARYTAYRSSPLAAGSFGKKNYLSRWLRGASVKKNICPAGCGELRLKKLSVLLTAGSFG
jgi:hypothetical protein